MSGAGGTGLLVGTVCEEGQKEVQCWMQDVFPSKLLMLFKKCVWLFVYKCVCATYVPGAHKGQKKTANPWN